VVTAPVVVAPFSVWAWRRLRAAGVPADVGRSSAWAMVLLPVTLGAVHRGALGDGAVVNGNSDSRIWPEPW